MAGPLSKPGRMPVTRALCVRFSIYQHARALVDRAAHHHSPGYEILFWLLIGAFGLLSLWEFYRMLDHKGLPNFKVTANDLRRHHARAAVSITSRKIGPADSYDFEVAVLLFFLLTVFARQMFERLRDDAPLRTMAYTFFGLLYVLWLYNFITKIVYVVPRSTNGAVTGQFYVLYLVAITKFSDMGAYLTGSVIGRHHMVPHISPKKTWEGFFGALVFSLLASWGLFKLDAGSSVRAELDTCDGARVAPWIRGGDRRSGGIDRETQHRREGFGKFSARNRRRA